MSADGLAVAVALIPVAHDGGHVGRERRSGPSGRTGATNACSSTCARARSRIGANARCSDCSRNPGCPTARRLGNLDEKLLPPKIRRLLPTLLEGGFVERAENVLAFGLPGRGKTHFLAAVGRELILRHRYPVLFTPTFKLVQQLLAAKKELRLESELKRLDRYAVVILDDLGYVQQDRQEMEVLFTFLAERYERRSVMISSNLVFSKWDQIFKDPMTTMAAIDRLVHHAIDLGVQRRKRAGPKSTGPSKKASPNRPEALCGSTPSLALARQRLRSTAQGLPQRVIQDNR